MAPSGVHNKAREGKRGQSRVLSAGGQNGVAFGGLVLGASWLSLVSGIGVMAPQILGRSFCLLLACAAALVTGLLHHVPTDGEPLPEYVRKRLICIQGS